MSGARAPLESLTAALGRDGGLKLWSVIVTVLGDLTAEPGAAISGPVLKALVEGIGLQPQAMRVALHRLRRDGWTDSARVGRTAHYRLSDMARAETEAVHARVYGPAPEVPGGLRLAVLPPDADPAAGAPDAIACVPLARGVVLAGEGALPAGWLAVPAAAMSRPGWAEARIAEAARAADYAALLGQLQGIAERPEAVLDRAVLRVLVLHGWRRLVLRSNPLAEALMGAEAPPARCRAVVAGLLRALPRPGPAALAVAVSGG